MYISLSKKTPYWRWLGSWLLALGLGGCASLPTTGTVKQPSGQIAFAVAGGGKPVVVLQSGLGDGKAAWHSIYSKIAQSNQVFAYDRPGYGESSPTRSTRDPCSIAAELHSTLQAAGLAPPYVLLGHSLGGLYQFVFAKLYPKEVSGLLLLDPTHPQHGQSMQQEVPVAAAMLKTIRATLFNAASRAEFDAQVLCLATLNLQTPLTVPVRLLTRTQFQPIEMGAFESMVRTLETDWLRLLGIQKVLHVKGAGHYIHQDQPDTVAQELQALIDMLPAP